ncbi:MAG: DUF1499 domain-containing protein [Gammaproteobacteria bacterium]|nr:DUF1499 domain-containing protein [Gammaproteobacteria bacterium]
MQESSKTAALASAIGVAACVSIAAGIAGIHASVLMPLHGFLIFAGAIAIGGLLSLMLGLSGLFITRKHTGAAARRKAITGTLIGAALVAALAAIVIDGRQYPRINDITTDVDDPPGFSSDAIPAYPDAFKALVKQHYPDLQTYRADAAPERAFSRAQAAAALQWTLTEADAAAGIIEATDTSALFQFVDDIVVRIRPDGTGSALDVRSRSRDGRGDFGVNAKRIRAFINQLKGA